MTKRTCTVCGQPATGGRGWCKAHYHRWVKYGDPQFVPTRPSVEQRFWAKVSKAEDCWLWTGGSNGDGYGHFYVDGKTQLAHRVSYELANGSIPGKLPLDHLCRVRLCVNPDHLEPVTLQENIRRGEAGAYLKGRTHCSQGHPYSEENTRITPKGRSCRACAQSYTAAWRERNPDKVAEQHESHKERRAAARREKPPAPPKTHCINGHPYDEENTFRRVDGRRGCKSCRREAQKRYNPKRMRVKKDA